jgi:hypothetical protein
MTSVATSPPGLSPVPPAEAFAGRHECTPPPPRRRMQRSRAHLLDATPRLAAPQAGNSTSSASFRTADHDSEGWDLLRSQLSVPARTTNAVRTSTRTRGASRVATIHRQGENRRRAPPVPDTATTASRRVKRRWRHRTGPALESSSSHAQAGLSVCRPHSPTRLSATLVYKWFLLAKLNFQRNGDVFDRRILSEDTQNKWCGSPRSAALGRAALPRISTTYMHEPLCVSVLDWMLSPLGRARDFAQTWGLNPRSSCSHPARLACTAVARMAVFQLDCRDPRWTLKLLGRVWGHFAGRGFFGGIFASAHDERDRIGRMFVPASSRVAPAGYLGSLVLRN